MLWGTQFCIIAEKLAGIHTKPYWMRALLRVPIAFFWVFLALLIPFYGTLFVNKVIIYICIGFPICLECVAGHTLVHSTPPILMHVGTRPR